jgi:hypothetical protein
LATHQEPQYWARGWPPPLPLPTRRPGGVSPTVGGVCFCADLLVILDPQTLEAFGVVEPSMGLIDTLGGNPQAHAEIIARKR